jgi:hypothetical protein
MLNPNMIKMFILTSSLEGDLVLVYDQDHEKLGAGKFEPLWHGPYIVSHVLQKWAYELVDYEGNPFLSLTMGSI